MGDYLQIRVSAWTYAPDKAADAWSVLYQLAWPKSSDQPQNKRGVLELVEALDQMRALGLWPNPKLGELINPAVKNIVEIKKALEAELADWQPGKANKLSYQLEEALEKLNDQVPVALLKKDAQ